MIVLIATIPARRASVERLLAALAKQVDPLDTVYLCLDGYEGVQTPAHGLAAVSEWRTAKPLGPGRRWRVFREIPPEENVVVLDDDHVIVGEVIGELSRALQGAPTGAAAHMGARQDGWYGAFPRGTPLIALAAGAMIIKAAALAGLDETVREVREKCGFDPFGDGGDDEAVVSAHLWRRGLPMIASGLLPVERDGAAEAAASQARKRVFAARAAGRPLSWQRTAIARALGWPWVDLFETR